MRRQRAGAEATRGEVNQGRMTEGGRPGANERGGLPAANEWADDEGRTTGGTTRGGRPEADN